MDSGLNKIAVLLPFRSPDLNQFFQALRSIEEQTADCFRLVLVADGAPQSARDLSRSFLKPGRGDILLTTEGLGLPRALNLGLQHINEPFIARMDADDVCFPNRFISQINHLSEHPEVVAVGSFVELIDADGAPIGLGFNSSTHHNDILDSLLCRRKDVSGICHPSVMMRTEAVQKVSGYRDVKMGEDIDLFLRLTEVGRLANIPEVLLKYRLHLASITHNRSEEERRDSQRVRIEAYQRLGIPLPDNLDVLLPAAPSDKMTTYRYWARTAARWGHLRTARKYAWRLILNRPTEIDSWKTFVRALFGYGTKARNNACQLP